MSRYDAPTPLQLAVLASLGRASSTSPVSFIALRARNATHPAAQVQAALDALIAGRFVSTIRQTKDGQTQDFYWPTGLKPIVPPTQEELSKMAESKTARLLRLILLHGPITGPDLASKATDEGGNIPAKNISGLLASALKKGEVIATKHGSTTTYSTAAQAGSEPAPVAQASSLPPAKDAGEGTGATETHQDTAPNAGHALLLERIAEIEAEKNQTAADLAGTHADLAAICRALDVPHAGEAVAAIEQLERLVTAKQSGGEIPVNETRHEPRGRLAILHTHDMVGGVLEYLEPYVSEADAREHVLTRVNRGDLEHCLLVRALFQARRQITYGPIEAPAFSTLQG